MGREHPTEFPEIGLWIIYRKAVRDHPACPLTHEILCDPNIALDGEPRVARPVCRVGDEIAAVVLAPPVADDDVVDVLVARAVDLRGPTSRTPDQHVGTDDATSMVGVDVDRGDVNAVGADLNRQSRQPVDDEQGSALVTDATEGIGGDPQLVLGRSVVPQEADVRTRRTEEAEVLVKLPGWRVRTDDHAEPRIV